MFAYDHMDGSRERIEPCCYTTGGQELSSGHWRSSLERVLQQRWVKIPWCEKFDLQPLDGTCYYIPIWIVEELWDRIGLEEVTS